MDMHTEMRTAATARARLVLARDHGFAGIRELARTEELVRIGRGVYLTADPAWEAWHRARVVNVARTIAVVGRGPELRACLMSAAVLWELPIWQHPTTVDVLVGRGEWRRSVALPSVVSAGSEVLRRHGWAVAEEDRAVVGDVRTIGLERLAVDVALQWHPRDALVTVDGILARLAEPNRGDRVGTEARADSIRADLAARLATTAQRRGLRRARAVIEVASPWSESPGESVTRWAALALGLPAPACQHQFTRSNGRFFYLDLFWDRFRAAAEFDGAVKYQGDRGGEVVVAEKKRDDEIRSTGIQVLHLDTATANRPALLASALRGLVPRDERGSMRPCRGLWTPELGSWSEG